MRKEKGRAVMTSRGLEEDYSSNRPGPTFHTTSRLIEQGLCSKERQEETLRILEAFELKVADF